MLVKSNCFIDKNPKKKGSYERVSSGEQLLEGVCTWL